MKPGIYNFNDVIQGDSINVTRFTITQTIDEVTTPIDLTGVAITAQFKSVSPPFPNIIKSVGKGITIIDAENGVFELDSFKIDVVGGFRYFIRCQFPNGLIKTYVKGRLNVYEDTIE